MRKYRWNVKKFVRNLFIGFIFGFGAYEFICFLNDVIIRCCMYYD